MPTTHSRFRVWRSSKARSFLCIAAARDERHALQVARQLFRLERSAFAVKITNEGSLSC